jgi:hypothetical protein
VSTPDHIQVAGHNDKERAPVDHGVTDRSARLELGDTDHALRAWPATPRVRGARRWRRWIALCGLVVGSVAACAPTIARGGAEARVTACTAPAAAFTGYGPVDGTGEPEATPSCPSEGS